MNVSGPSSSDSIQAAVSPELKRAQLQAALLKKILQAQQQDAAELQNMAAGKGQVLDIRV